MTTTHCTHHWIIKPPEGPVSIGRCSLCGEERKFSDSGEARVNWALLSREARNRLEKGVVWST